MHGLGQAVAIYFWWDVIAVTTTMFARHNADLAGSFSMPLGL